jgi:hypothetical protein
MQQHTIVAADEGVTKLVLQLPIHILLCQGGAGLSPVYSAHANGESCTSGMGPVFLSYLSRLHRNVHVAVKARQDACRHHILIHQMMFFCLLRRPRVIVRR